MSDKAEPVIQYVLSSSQMSAADRHTIEELKIPGQELMERAGDALLRELLKRRSSPRKILVLSGKGNNGGDGFVVARKAVEMGLRAEVLLFSDSSLLKNEAKIAFEKCKDKKVKILDTTQLEKAFEDVDCIVDAIYGINFRGALSGLESEAAKISNYLRKAKSLFVVSVDLPSGTVCDTGQVDGVSFECDLTVTFQAFKPAHFCFPAAKFSGERVCVDIGIQADLFAKSSLINPSMFSNSLLMTSSGHKGVRGHLAVVAGSPGHSGAAALTARAGLRAGAGLVTLFSDQQSCSTAVEFTPEIMTSPSSNEGLQKISALKKGAIVIGPGLEPDTALFTSALEAGRHLPKVIDASAIRILANRTDPSMLENAILTPHPGEMATLLNCSTEDVTADRFGSARRAALKYKCAVLLKGAYSLIAFPDERVFVSPFANSNLGTAGSGDVLSGLIGGLLSRGLSLENASCLAVYLHGSIGSTLLPRGLIGSLASEFADNFPTAFAAMLAAPVSTEPVSLPAAL